MDISSLSHLSEQFRWFIVLGVDLFLRDLRMFFMFFFVFLVFLSSNSTVQPKWNAVRVQDVNGLLFVKFQSRE